MQGHAILSGQDRLAQRGLGWTAAIIACLSSLALFGLGQPVTAQDSSVRISDPAASRANVPYRTEWNPRGERDFIHLNSIVRELVVWRPAARSVSISTLPTRNRRSMTPRRTIWIGCACGSYPRSLASQRHPKCLPIDPSCPGTPGKRGYFRIVQPDHSSFARALGQSRGKQRQCFWSTSAPGVSFQYEYNVPLEFQIHMHPDRRSL